MNIINLFSHHFPKFWCITEPAQVLHPDNSVHRIQRVFYLLYDVYNLGTSGCATNSVNNALIIFHLRDCSQNQPTTRLLTFHSFEKIYKGPISKI